MTFERLALGMLAILCMPAATALADDYPAVPLLSASKTIMGEDIVYPTTGKAVVDAVIVTIGPGKKTIVHEHGVPMFAYILEGELTVDYGEKGKKIYKTGDSFMEAMKVDHAGSNLTDKPVRILAVYMGAEGSKDVIPVQ